ncbi:MAG: hypothetical protein K0Q75_1178 [Anaerospora sp.]|jgi:hypothetical protein|nr:hypothetical protein [Anaerospora sp.]
MGLILKKGNDCQVATNLIRMYLVFCIFFLYITLAAV